MICQRRIGVAEKNVRKTTFLDKPYGMPIKETDEARSMAWLMEMYREKVQPV